MRKSILLLVILFLSFCSFGQNLIFTSEYGGDHNNGAIVKYDPDSDQLNTLVSLDGSFLTPFNILYNTAMTPSHVKYQGGLIKGQDGYYYGIYSLSTGKTNLNVDHTGVFYRLDPITYDLEVLHAFTGNGAFSIGVSYPSSNYNEDLSFPVFRVIEASPGIFYGLTRYGGTHNEGGIWKYNVNTSVYTKIADFSSAGLGTVPLCPLIMGPNNELYGITLNHSGYHDGYLYKVNTANDAVTYVNNLSTTGLTIYRPKGEIVHLPGTSKIYGCKSRGNDGINGGGVYSYDLSTNITTNETSIGSGQWQTIGNNPNGMVLAPDGNLYFTCDGGGNSGNGSLVKYTPGVNTMVKLVDFDNHTTGFGFNTYAAKIIAPYRNGSNTGNALWTYDVSNLTFEMMLPVSTALPGYNMSLNFAIDNNLLIGHMMNSGDQDAGAIFQLDLLTDQTSVLVDNRALNGRNMVGEILNINDSILLAYVGKGGNSEPDNYVESGYMARVNLNNGQVDQLDAWTQGGQNQSVKTNAPVYASDGFLYYNAYIEFFGSRKYRFYRYNLSTDQREQLMSLNDGVETTMTGWLEYEPGKLITTWVDKVYVYDAVQQIFTLTKTTHDPSLYGVFHGNLVLASDGRIYGMTKAILSDPTTGHDAVIFSLDVTNFDFQIEHTLDNNIRVPGFGLTEYNGKLWGSTNFTGANGDGFLYSFDIGTNTFTNEYDFNSPADGGGFEAGWTELNGKLYSTSYTGGTLGFGTLVEFDPSTGQLTVKKNFTAATGRAWRSTPAQYTAPVLDSIVPSSGSQNSTVSTTIYGSNTLFSASSTVQLINPADPTEIIIGTITQVISQEQLEVDFSIPLTATAGIWDLKVDLAELSNAFTITQVYPEILDFDPSTAETGVTINSNITGGNTQWMNNPNPVVTMTHHNTPTYTITAYNVIVVNDELITTDFDIPANAFTGNYDIHVDNLTLDNGFAVVLPNVPVLHSIVPNSEIQGNSVLCTIEAFYTTFTQGGIPDVLLEYGMNPAEVITGQNVTVISDTELEVTFDIPFSASTGLYDLWVDNLILSDAFTVLTSGVTLAYVNPDNGFIGEFLPLEIHGNGTQFAQQGVSSVYMSYSMDPNEMINAISFAVVNDTLIEATFGFPTNTSIGMWDVWVDMYSLADGFELMDQTKSIVSMDPDSAYQGDFITMEVKSTGTYFTQGVNDVFLEYDSDPQIFINAISVTAINDTTLLVDFGFPYNSDVGLYNLIVDDMQYNEPFTLLLVTSVDNNEADEVIIYPNPFDNKLSIVSSEKNINLIEVYDNTGVKVISVSPDSREYTIETNTLGKGLYYLKVTNSEGDYTIKKIIK